MPQIPDIPIPGREYHRHETSQSISGTFTFYDVLDLSTSSGSINIRLDPQPGDGPAVLRLRSQSGSVTVKLSDDYMKRLGKQNISPRPWHTTIITTSGSVRIKIPITGGSTTSIDTNSASIGAVLYATNIGPGDAISTLSTSSDSGSQNIEVQSTLGTAVVSNLAARHHSRGSASMKISYPQAWQGRLHASVGGSASVKVQGQGLQFSQHGDRETFAWRGEGQPMEVRCDGSGSIKVDCSAS
jgi:hypothetical protein